MKIVDIDKLNREQQRVFYEKSCVSGIDVKSLMAFPDWKRACKKHDIGFDLDQNLDNEFLNTYTVQKI